MIFSILFSLAGFVGGCDNLTPRSSGVSEYAPIQEYDVVARPDIRLPLLAAAAGLSTDQIVVEQASIAQSNLRKTAIRFDQVTETQFDKMRSHFAGLQGVQSAVTWSSSRSIVIEDVLPPVMQATLDMRFYPSSDENVEHLAGEMYRKGFSIPDIFRLSSNCWGTAWEVARLWQGKAASALSVFYAGGEVLSAFRDEKLTMQIQMNSVQGAGGDDEALRNKKLKPGDVLLILESNSLGAETLVHAATFIDHDLYFEKSGIDARATYRITTLAEILDLYGGVVQGANRSLEWRRFSSGDIPHPRELFSQRPEGLPDARIPDYVVIGEHKGQVTAGAMVDVTLMLDSETSRARLAPEASQVETFVIDKSCTKPCFKCLLRAEDKSGQTVEFEIRAVSDSMSNIYLFGTAKNQTFKPIFPRGGLRLDSVVPSEWAGEWEGKQYHLRFESNRVTAELTSDGFSQIQTERCSWRN